MKTPIEKFAHRNMGLAHELSGHVYFNGAHNLGEIPDCLDRIKQASEELDKFEKEGVIPHWMKDSQ